MLMLGLGRGSWAVSKKHTLIPTLFIVPKHCEEKWHLYSSLFHIILLVINIRIHLCSFDRLLGNLLSSKGKVPPAGDELD